MKKLILKKYDDGKIRFYKTFKTKGDLLDFADEIATELCPLNGPTETMDKIIYSVNLKWYLHRVRS